MNLPFTSLRVRWWERTAFNNLVLQKYAKAEEYFRKVAAVEPYRFGLGHNLALVCLAQERYDDAEKYFLDELDRYGESFVRLKSLGDLYYIWGKPEKCREYYEKAFPLCQHEADKRQLRHKIDQCGSPPAFENGQKSLAALKRGNQKMTEKDFDGAEVCLKEAVGFDSCNFQAWNNLGALEMNIKKDVAEAVKYFEKAAFYTSLTGIHGNLKKARETLAKESKK
jgi:tetratricopeptide (TPR) repeat protein